MSTVSRWVGIAGLVALGLLGCDASQTIDGNGVIVSESRSVDGFTGLSLSGAYDVNVTCGKELSIIIKTDQNIMPLILTELRGSTLHIFTQEHYSVSPSGKTVVSITVPALTAVAVSGEATVALANVDNQETSCSVSGSASVSATGKTKNLVLDASGTVDFLFKDLDAQNVTIAISGSGNAVVSATQSLSVSLTGTGSVSYYGNPPQVIQNITGTGTLIKL
jgi:hypothetical protein